MNFPRQLVIFGGGVVVIAAFVGYMFIAHTQLPGSTPSTISTAQTNPPSNSNALTNDISTSTSPDLATSPTSIYTDSHYGFTFQYPSGITIDTYDPGDLNFNFPDDFPYPELLLSVEQPEQDNIDDYFYGPTVAADGGSAETSLYAIAKQSQEDVATTTLGGVTAIETSFKCGIAYPETIDNGDPTGETIILAIYDNNLYQLDAPNTCSNPAVLSALEEVRQSFKFVSDK